MKATDNAGGQEPPRKGIYNTDTYSTVHVQTGSWRITTWCRQ